MWDKILIGATTLTGIIGINCNYDLSQAESSYASGCNNYNVKMLKASDAKTTNTQIEKFFTTHKNISTIQNMRCGDGGDPATAKATNAYQTSFASHVHSYMLSSNNYYNWAGVEISSLNNKNIIKNYIATNFTVPAINGKLNNGTVCYWTGLGTRNIIQNGVSTSQDAGKTYNNFWWEILDKKDKGMMTIQNLPVKAKDKVYSATYWKNGSGYFLLANLTTNKAAFFTVKNVFNPGNPAEIVTERPQFSSGSKNTFSNILNFNKVSYSVDVGQARNITLLYDNDNMINYRGKDMASNSLMDNYNYTTFWHSNS